MKTRQLVVPNVSSDVRDLQKLVYEHEAVTVLTRFEREFEKAPLTDQQLRLLLASESCFILPVPPGILALASRVTDEYFGDYPFDCTGIAARVLYAAVDEYGLSDVESGLLPSHHELYAKMASHWDISRADLASPENIVPEAAAFANVISEFYRARPVAQSLGFHIANETTAPLDFGMMNRVFTKYRVEYRLQEGDPFLEFLRIHDQVEESHALIGMEMLELYIRDRRELLSEARVGVAEYMDAYGAMFNSLGKSLFPAWQPAESDIR